MRDPLQTDRLPWVFFACFDAIAVRMVVCEAAGWQLFSDGFRENNVSKQGENYNKPDLNHNFVTNKTPDSLPIHDSLTKWVIAFAGLVVKAVCRDEFACLFDSAAPVHGAAVR